jgi:hypothetical protein
MFSPSFYVPVWFPIVHHYFCQFQIKLKYHEHEKALANLAFDIHVGG